MRANPGSVRKRGGALRKVSRTEAVGVHCARWRGTAGCEARVRTADISLPRQRSSKVLKGGAVPARVRSACGSAESQCVASAGITRCVRSTNGGGIRAGSPFAPVASRGRAGSREAAWCARWAGDGRRRARTPLKSKPEQESLLLRGRRSCREPPYRRQVEEGAARPVSVTEGPPRVRGCYPQDLAVGPGLFSAAGPTSHATAPLCTPYPEFPGHLGPLPTAPPRTLTHRPLRCVASFFFPFLRCPGPLPRIPFAVQFWYLQAPGWRALLIMTLSR